MDQRVLQLFAEAYGALNAITTIVGAQHVLSNHVREAQQALDELHFKYTELWEILEAQTKPEEAKKEFQEVEK
jgi:hypothetical protein